jgi:hypothetical protein
MAELILYSAACRAIQAARSTDECKDIADRAEAARSYAKMAKNRELEIDAAEIRIRAERRLGEILVTMRQQKVLVAANQRPKRKEGQVSISDLGLNYTFVAAAKSLATLSEAGFENSLERWRSESKLQNRISLPLVEVRRRDVSHHKKDRALNSDPYATPKTLDGRPFGYLSYGELRKLLGDLRRHIKLAERILAHASPAEPTTLVRDVITHKKLHEMLNDK